VDLAVLAALAVRVQTSIAWLAPCSLGQIPFLASAA
jgi:hypothetical protein